MAFTTRVALWTLALGCCVRAAPTNLLGNHFGVAGSDATFDYVVIGGGMGGLTTAYRLAEDGTRSVAVIEAGGFYEVENGNTSIVPSVSTKFQQTRLIHE